MKGRQVWLRRWGGGGDFPPVFYGPRLKLKFLNSTDGKHSNEKLGAKCDEMANPFVMYILITFIVQFSALILPRTALFILAVLIAATTISHPANKTDTIGKFSILVFLHFIVA